MIDQSHNLIDPIEDLLVSCEAISRACVKAMLVDRNRLVDYQENNEVLLASQTLKEAYERDVSALLAELRLRKGGALNPIKFFRESNYRNQCVLERV